MVVKRVSGTREWSVKSANCILGCSHNCRYCYSRRQMVDRFKLVKPGEWTQMKVRERALRKRWKKVVGNVMFPTTHDITPDTIEPCLKMISNILEPGNNILIVSKPHLSCISEICQKFGEYKDRILFRFTIGALFGPLLAYWEPGAPSPEERLECLKLAFTSGFGTSISMEPLLDPENLDQYLDKMLPFVSDSIWIGLMNKIDQRVKIETEEDARIVAELKKWQTEEKVLEMYNRWKDTPKIKWKESVKQIVGLPLLEEDGLDQ